MTTSAWWMLGVTWTIVALITGRFFFRVLTLPQRSKEEKEKHGRG